MCEGREGREGTAAGTMVALPVRCWAASIMGDLAQSQAPQTQFPGCCMLKLPHIFITIKVMFI